MRVINNSFNVFLEILPGHTLEFIFVCSNIQAILSKFSIYSEYNFSHINILANTSLLKLLIPFCLRSFLKLVTLISLWYKILFFTVFFLDKLLKYFPRYMLANISVLSNINSSLNFMSKKIVWHRCSKS